jgi:phage-related protein
MIAQFIATIAQNLPQILQQGIEIIGKLQAGLIQAIPKVVAAIPKIIISIVDTFRKYDWLSIGINIIKGIAKGITGAAGEIARAAKNAAKKAFDAAKDFLGIHSPSTVFRDQIGKYMALGMAEGFEDNIPVDDMQNSLDGMVNGLSTTKVKGNNGNVVSTSDNYTFNIYQREGENDTEFARRIADIINSDVQRKRAVYA